MELLLTSFLVEKVSQTSLLLLNGPLLTILSNLFPLGLLVYNTVVNDFEKSNFENVLQINDEN